MSVPSLGPAHPVPPPATPTTSSPPRGGDSFRAHLGPVPGAAVPPSPPAASPATGDSLGPAARRLLERMAAGERDLDRVVREAAHRGGTFSPAELLLLQARVYRHTQDLDLVSRLVDRTTQAVKTILTQNG